MGNNLGTPEHKRKYTDSEIKQNMKVLFENNKHNSVETSYSLGENLEVSTEKKGSVGGYKKIKFQSSRNRHLNHNIDAFLKQQNGGGKKSQNEDVVKNFNKIKEYLMNDLDSNVKEEQYGGNDSDIGSFSFDSSDDDQNNLSFFGAMRGGNAEVDTSSLGTTTKLSDPDDSSTSSSSSSGSTESDNTLESSELDTDTTETNNSTISKTSTVSETLPTEGELTPTSNTTTTTTDTTTTTTDTTTDTDTRDDEPFIVQSTESSIDTSITMNEYNNNSESSELNIVPFYSSETSNKRPHVSRRFK